VFTGSLCGQYPDTAAWLFLLALADKNGEVDMTAQYIATVTGMPLADLAGCIQRFLDVDPQSRSQESQGRRLELIDPSRPWGWRLVNFNHYREKARLTAKSAREVESGRNAERLRHRAGGPPDTAADRRSPPLTDPSNANANTDTDTDTGVSVASQPHSGRPEKSQEADVDRVFNHWREVHHHPRARLDNKRRTLIRKALAQYPAADLCQAIAGYLNSPHHMGQNPQGTTYTAIELLLRDAAHIEAGIRFYESPPRTDVSGLTRKNVAAIADWQPPEVRRAGQ